MKMTNTLKDAKMTNTITGDVISEEREERKRNSEAIEKLMKEKFKNKS